MLVPTKVTYDRSLKLLAVSPSVWMSVGPVQWFDNYRIISVIDNPLQDTLRSIDLRRFAQSGEILPGSIEGIYNSSIFSRMKEQLKLQEFQSVLNRSMKRLSTNKGMLGNSYETAHQYENKLWFRQQFDGSLHFPEFQLVSISELKNDETIERLLKEFSSGVVLQHAQLGGGRGTYLVKNKLELSDAISELSGYTQGENELVVVSRRVNDARERSLQACVTSDGVVIGPAQSQLVRHPLLVSRTPGDMQFCGGRIAEDIVSDQEYEEMEKSATIIGESLRKDGYKGIFGVDFMINSDGVYVLETNPRMTGLTPLLSFLQEEVPILLLHILELAGSRYEINGSLKNKPQSGSFIELYAQDDGRIECETGVYTQQLERVGDGFENGSLLPDNMQDFFVGIRTNKTDIVTPGKSLAFIYSRQQLFNDEGVLSPSAELFVRRLREKFVKSQPDNAQ